MTINTRHELGNCKNEWWFSTPIIILIVVRCFCGCCFFIWHSRVLFCMFCGMYYDSYTTKEILFRKCADERKPSVARFFHFKCTHNVIIFLLHYWKFRFSASVVDIGILHKSSMHVLDYKLIRLIACKMQ